MIILIVLAIVYFVTGGIFYMVTLDRKNEATRGIWWRWGWLAIKNLWRNLT